MRAPHARCRGGRGSRRGRTRTGAHPARCASDSSSKRRSDRPRAASSASVASILNSLNDSTSCGLPSSAHLEVLLRQVGDRLALLVGDDDVDADEVDAGRGTSALRLIRAALPGRRPCALAAVGRLWRRWPCAAFPVRLRADWRVLEARATERPRASSMPGRPRRTSASTRTTESRVRTTRRAAEDIGLISHGR